MSATLRQRIEQATRDEQARAAAWLSLDQIVGIVVKPFTLRHWLFLTEAENPILLGQVPASGHIAQFLWVIRTDFDWRSKPRKDWFKRIGKLNTTEVVDEIVAYLSRAFYDLQGGGDPDKTSVDVAGWPAYFVHRYGKLYGWSVDQVMDTPLAQLGQLDRVDRAESGDNSAYTSTLIALRAQEIMERNNR